MAASRPEDQEYRLWIDALSVETLPMARLATYMADLACLLGEPERVHFERLEPGSAVLVSRIERPAVPKVNERLRAVRDGRGPQDAMQAFAALDASLARDNATARLIGEAGGDVIAFPGRTRVPPERYGPFREAGSLDGVVIRVGGRADKIPVLIMDAHGAEYACSTSVELSKQLAAHYRGATVRVHGVGRWVREGSGSWTLQDFAIERFDVLDDAPLTTVVAALRAVEGGEWGDEAASLLRREDGLPN
jgi:hypothetical protein